MLTGELNHTQTPTLTAQDLLAGSRLIHEIEIPSTILNPQSHSNENATGATVRIRPLNLSTMTLIAKATRDDTSLVSALMIKEALVEPTVTLDQIRQMHVGLVHYLVSQINLISGLSAEGEALTSAVSSPIGQTHLLLAKHFGWTPEQVSQLTPGQVAVYLAGIEKLLAWEHSGRETP